MYRVSYVDQNEKISVESEVLGILDIVGSVPIRDCERYYVTQNDVIS